MAIINYTDFLRNSCNDTISLFKIFSGMYLNKGMYDNNPEITFALSHNYGQDIITVLRDTTPNLTVLKKMFPEVWDNFSSTNDFNKDDRTIGEFARTLVGGWLYEDLVADDLNEGGIPTARNGCDAQRHLRSGVEANHNADLSLTWANCSLIPMEVQQSVQRGGKDDFAKQEVMIKENKLKKLSHDNALLLQLGLRSRCFKLIDLSKPFKTEPSNYSNTISSFNKNFVNIVGTNEHEVYDYSSNCLVEVTMNTINNR